MPFLEILHYTGDVERRELSKQAPIMIGSHSRNDIQIDEDNVEMMHCRISWAKKGYEAVAVGVEPLDVNGTPMQRASLSSGDVLRFGSVDIRYRDSEDDGGDRDASAEVSNELGLKPISGEFDALQSSLLKEAASKSTSSSPAKPAKPSKEKSRKAASEAKSGSAPPPEASGDEDEKDSWEMDRGADAFNAALDALAAESQGKPAAAPTKTKQRGKPKASPATEQKQSEAPPPAPAETETAPRPAAAPAETGRTSEPADGMSDRVRRAMRSQQRRPGEEDPLRSPLVLGLFGGAMVLLLTGAIFFFIATRQTTQQAFDAAKAYYDEGNFRSSIEAFQNFILAHPQDDLTDDAKQLLGLAQVRQYIETASPKFEEGLNQLRTFISDQQDLERFELLHPEIVTHAKKISLDAAVAAGRQFKPDLLEISRQARTILKTYAPKEAPPTETLEQIEQSLRASEAAILRDDVYKNHLAAIDAALKDNQPLKALQRRRDLLVRYPEFERDKKVIERMRKTLEAERARVVEKDLDTAAETTDHEWPQNGLTLAFQGRTRTDEVPVGQAVIVLAQDCCYGVELITGKPLWRRVIGFESPFFPLIDTDSSSVILFDSNYQELVCLDQHSGKLRWRQPLQAAVTGQPLLTSDAVYVPTDDARLLAVDVANGQLTGQLQFSQPVSGPAELEGEQQIVVAGNEEVVYTLTKRPFACERVFDLGHAPDSIQAPLLTMASYLLVIENGNSKSTLNLLKTSPTEPLKIAATGQVAGRVLDQPVIRGRDLFVPSSGERVAAFSLSDDPGQPPLTTGPVYQGEGMLSNPAYLLTGPDRQLWMATGALMRLRLTTDSIQPDSDAVARGLTTQPLQFLSGFLFHARRRPYTQAVTITRTDRDELRSDWQAVLGGPILAWSGDAGNDLNIATVNDAGHIFRIGKSEIEDGQFLTDTSARLPLHQDLMEPLLGAAVGGDRLAVACGGPEPRLWLINAVGQIVGSPTLPAPPQAAPCAMGDDVLVPIKERIHVQRPSGRSPAQDFSLPTGAEQTWTSVTSAGDQQAIAVTAKGLVLLLRLENTPRVHLGESARVELGQAVASPGAAGNGLYAVADGSGRLSVFDTERLEPRGTRTFPMGVAASPWIIGQHILVSEAYQQLHCLESEGDLAPIWSLDLGGTAVTGIAEHDGQYIVALQDGRVLTVDPQNGQTVAEWKTFNRLAFGPVKAKQMVFVGTADGTLLRLP